jgi:sortase A
VQAVAALLILSGAVVLGVQGWQLLVVTPRAADAQTDAARAVSADWSSKRAPASAPARRIPVRAEPATDGATVAVIRVPRFGRDWSRVVRQGVDEAEVLNSVTAGVGHYVHSAMPGAVGNFAIAGHDTGWGNAFLHVADLRIGDRILVQTADGWYTYRFRNLQWVPPTGTEVLEPVPGRPGVPATDRLITLTTCDPPYDAKERLIAYGVLQGFRPIADGPPAGA